MGGILAADGEPSEEGFHEDREEEGAYGIPLEGASMDVDWDCISVYGHIVCVGGSVELFASRYV
jgi:hypothetical protein